MVFAKHRRTIEVAKDSNIRISNVHVFLDAPLNSFHRKMEYREVTNGDDWLRTYAIVKPIVRAPKEYPIVPRAQKKLPQIAGSTSFHGV